MLLPKDCVLKNIEEIYATISEQLGEGSNLSVSAIEVERVDESFIQLLLALNSSNISLTIDNPSESFADALTMYHLSGLLEADA